MTHLTDSPHHLLVPAQTMLILLSLFTATLKAHSEKKKQQRLEILKNCVVDLIRFAHLLSLEELFLPAPWVWSVYFSGSVRELLRSGLKGFELWLEALLF